MSQPPALPGLPRWLQGLPVREWLCIPPPSRAAALLALFAGASVLMSGIMLPLDRLVRAFVALVPREVMARLRLASRDQEEEDSIIEARLENLVYHVEHASPVWQYVVGKLSMDIRVEGGLFAVVWGRRILHHCQPPNSVSDLYPVFSSTVQQSEPRATSPRRAPRKDLDIENSFNPEALLFGEHPPPPVPPATAAYICENPNCRDWKDKSGKKRGRDGVLRCRTCDRFFRIHGYDRPRETVCTWTPLDERVTRMIDDDYSPKDDPTGLRKQDINGAVRPLNREEWTSDEDRNLVQLHTKYGSQWKKISAEFGRANRTPVSLKARWERIQRRRVEGPEAQLQTPNSQRPPKPRHHGEKDVDAPSSEAGDDSVVPFAERARSLRRYDRATDEEKLAVLHYFQQNPSLIPPGETRVNYTKSADEALKILGLDPAPDDRRKMIQRMRKKFMDLYHGSASFRRRRPLDDPSSQPSRRHKERLTKEDKERLEEALHIARAKMPKFNNTFLGEWVIMQCNDPQSSNILTVEDLRKKKECARKYLERLMKVKASKGEKLESQEVE